MNIKCQFVRWVACLSFVAATYADVSGECGKCPPISPEQDDSKCRDSCGLSGLFAFSCADNDCNGNAVCATGFYAVTGDGDSFHCFKGSCGYEGSDGKCYKNSCVCHYNDSDAWLTNAESCAESPHSCPSSWPGGICPNEYKDDTGDCWDYLCHCDYDSSKKWLSTGSTCPDSDHPSKACPCSPGQYRSTTDHCFDHECSCKIAKKEGSPSFWLSNDDGCPDVNNYCWSYECTCNTDQAQAYYSESPCTGVSSSEIGSEGSCPFHQGGCSDFGIHTCSDCEDMCGSNGMINGCSGSSCSSDGSCQCIDCTNFGLQCHGMKPLLPPTPPTPTPPPPSDGGSSKPSSSFVDTLPQSGIHQGGCSDFGIHTCSDCEDMCAAHGCRGEQCSNGSCQCNSMCTGMFGLQCHGMKPLLPPTPPTPTPPSPSDDSSSKPSSSFVDTLPQSGIHQGECSDFGINSCSDCQAMCNAHGCGGDQCSGSPPSTCQCTGLCDGMFILQCTGSSSLAIGVMIAVVVGALLAIGACIGCCICCRRRGPNASGNYMQVPTNQLQADNQAFVMHTMEA